MSNYLQNAISILGLINPEVRMATMGDGRPDNTSADLLALQAALRQAKQGRAKGDRMAPSSAMPSWVNGSMAYSPHAPVTPQRMVYDQNELNPIDAMVLNKGPTPVGPITPPAAAAPSAPTQAAVDPTPAPRPDLGWFKRNAYLQTDPSTGAFLDPSLAAQANATTGPNLIKKFMGYLNNKDIG